MYRRIAFITRRLALPTAALALTAGSVAAQAPARAVAPTPVLAGRWQGAITYDSLSVDFPLEWSGTGKALALSFFNGDTRMTSTSVVRSGDSLVASFAQLATELRGTLDHGVLTATYGPPLRRNPVVVARPGSPAERVSVDAPDITGIWHLPTHSAKGEDAWRLVITSREARLTATILRIDGDAGALVGTWQDSAYVLNHFDGTRPARLVIRPNADSTLSVAYQTGPRGVTTRFTALRPDAAKAAGLPEPADFATFTSVRDPAEPFRFAFPGLDGQLVSNTDARFQGKVVIVTIGGSWCPNCHDEAPFVEAMYEKYRARGLEVVGLDFEQKEALTNLDQVRAFVAKYGITYPLLVAGQPSEVKARLPQAVNLNTWPATFFLGRDGTVRAVRSGFAAPASGEFHTRLERDYADIIEGLLREPY